jgi:hypothetical protein
MTLSERVFASLPNDLGDVDMIWKRMNPCTYVYQPHHTLEIRVICYADKCYIGILRHDNGHVMSVACANHPTAVLVHIHDFHRHYMAVRLDHFPNIGTDIIHDVRDYLI